jgi:hypothetical protein
MVRTRVIAATRLTNPVVSVMAFARHERVIRPESSITMGSSRARVDDWMTRHAAGRFERASALVCIRVFGLLVLVVSSGDLASAQPLPTPRILPNQQPLPMPAPQAAGRSPSLLPPAPLPGEGTESALDRGLAIEVGVVEILGNTVLPAESLEEIACS